jgi:extracellular factor (EF) 3-hydroxypalmitic acid methyl ester biosynthesis protein
METKTAPIANPDQASFVSCLSNSGIQVQATLLHFTRFQAVFEVYTPALGLRMSEVLTNFQIVVGEGPIYSGRAVISSLVSTGSVTVCEVNLDDGWIDIGSIDSCHEDQLHSQFDGFLRRWQKHHKILPEFKVVVADMESLLTDMQLWMGQVELSIRSSPSGERLQMEKDAARGLAAVAIPVIEALGDRFEEIAATVEPDLRPAHIHFARRRLHPTLLCSPFSYRVFHKPLGYAGDYEMVNMIVREPFEGGSLFAKIVNAWFLNQLPAQAHRNRIKVLKERLVDEAALAARLGRPARVFNLGCGPAGEIKEFLAESQLADQTQLTLLDFNEETLQHTGNLLREVSQRFSRRPVIQMQKKSVQQLLKEAARPRTGASSLAYDFLYCAGLFDYLPDRVCKQLMGVFYHWLAPGGLLLVTNVDGTRPFHNKLEFILDWNLIYRNVRQMATLAPEHVRPDDSRIYADDTGVNLFLEIRKPPNG